MVFVTDVLTDTPLPILVSVRGDSPTSSPVARVELDLSKFHNGRWAVQLDATFSRGDAPVVILARGVACLAIAWWAQLSPRSYLRSVRGAVFDSPLAVDMSQVAVAAAIRSGPAYRLPFPSIVVNDASFRIGEVLHLADKWGSRFVEKGGASAGQPSNRNGRFTEAEDGLLAYLDVLDRNVLAPQSHAAQHAEVPVLASQD
ncbi:MAG: alpha/beta hydrolase [Pseudomonadota bacterium]